MKRLLLVVLFSCMALLGLAAAFGIPRLSDRTPFFLGGIKVNESDLGHWVRSLRAAGLNTVEVTAYARQWDWDSDDLQVEPIDEGIVEEIRTAKREGLNVVLVLRVALDHAFERNKFLWHGMIMPRDERDLRSWFDRYRAFVLQWAEVSEREDVDVLVIGSELNALAATEPIERMPPLLEYFNSKERQEQHEKRVLRFSDRLEEEHLWVGGFGNYASLEAYIDDRIAANLAWARQVSFQGDPEWLRKMNDRRQLVRERWVDVIRKSRRIYRGKLTYAANFDNYFDVDFWPLLDYLGINAYFPLRDPSRSYSSESDLRNALEEGWTGIFQEINVFKEENGIPAMPILFTELGYIYRRNATVQPWSGFGFSVVGPPETDRLIVWGDEPVNWRERALAVEALHTVVTRDGENLAGILYWKLTTQEEHLEVEPFVLPLGTDPADELLEALIRFTRQG